MTQTATTPTDALAAGTYDVPDLAGLMKCSGRHVRDLAAAGTIPGMIRFGRLVRFHKGIVNDWLTTEAKGAAVSPDVLPLRLAATEPPTSAPLLVDAKQLHPRLSVGLRTLRSMDAAGKLPRPLRLGGKVLWKLAEIEAWIQAGCPDRETWEARRVARN